MGESHDNIIIGKYYPVFTGKGALTQLKSFIGESFISSRIFILTDENVEIECLPLLIRGSGIKDDTPVLAVPPGESSKDMPGVVRIWEWLDGYQADRSDLLINLGGGVVSDLGGFAAGTFKRGISFVNVPTTLIAQVDAAIGGKTGINLNRIKNNVGLFNHPAAIFIDQGFLTSLPGREFRSGFAEIIKTSLISGGKFWEQVCSGNFTSDNHLDKFIRMAAAAKLQLTDADPRDIKERQALNFGHSIGHALESCYLEPARKKLLHGEAIAIGMICEGYLSVKLEGLRPEILEMLISVIRRFFDPIKISDPDFDRIRAYLLHDKKNSGEDLLFTLLSAPGKPLIKRPVDPDLPDEALRFYLDNFPDDLR